MTPSLTYICNYRICYEALIRNQVSEPQCHKHIKSLTPIVVMTSLVFRRLLAHALVVFVCHRPSFDDICLQLENMLEAEEAARAALAAHLGITAAPAPPPSATAADLAGAAITSPGSSSSAGMGGSSGASFAAGLGDAAAAHAAGGGVAYGSPPVSQQGQQGAWRFTSPFLAAATAEAGPEEYGSTGDLSSAAGTAAGDGERGLGVAEGAEGMKIRAADAAADMLSEAAYSAGAAYTGPSSAAAAGGSDSVNVDAGYASTASGGGGGRGFVSPFAFVQQYKDGTSAAGAGAIAAGGGSRESTAFHSAGTAVTIDISGVL